MSRYLQVGDIVFTDSNGKQHVIKDRRAILPGVTAYELDIKTGDTLDEISSRLNVFGEFGESRSYQIFDQNAEKITENKYTLTNLKKLSIPQ